MSAIKAIVSVFSQGQEKPIERYKSRILLSDEHKESLNSFEKHLSDFLGLKDKMRTLGLGQYRLKLYRISKVRWTLPEIDDKMADGDSVGPLKMATHIIVKCMEYDRKSKFISFE